MSKALENRGIGTSIASFISENEAQALTLQGEHAHLHLDALEKFAIGNLQGDAGITGRRIANDFVTAGATVAKARSPTGIQTRSTG